MGDLPTLVPSDDPGTRGDAREAAPDQGAGPTRVRSIEPLRIGRFAVLRLIGEGGMGRVYSAYDERLDRRVALKLLRHEVDAASRLRVVREAKAMARLSHPNVVQVFEVGDEDGSLFIAMEFVTGQTLAKWQAARGRRWREVLDAYIQAGEGLAAAHGAGLIHRDFKPANAMVDVLESGALRVRVLDFGLARVSDGRANVLDSLLPSTGREPSNQPTLTASGGLLGTPAYMAPEQFSSAAVDARADQFSLCASLWEGLYGQRPFRGESVVAQFAALRSGNTPRPPSGSDVPGWVHAAVLRGVCITPELRYESMAELLSALARDPAKRRRKWLWLAASLPSVAAAATALSIWSESRRELCSGAQQELAGVWDDERRSDASAAILGTNLPYAAVASESSLAALDAYAEQWRDGFRDACEATRTRGEQTEEEMRVRRTCLHQARRELHAVVEVIAAADAATVEHASSVIAELPRLEQCGDVDALLRAAEKRPPAEEEAIVENVRAVVAEARARRAAGLFVEAKARVAAAEEIVEHLRYEPVRTEVVLERGVLATKMYDEGAAEPALREALRLAARWNQEEQMQEATASLIYVVGQLGKRFDEALRYRELAEELAHDDASRRAHAAHSLGTVYYAQGRYADAEAEQRKAVELNAQAFGGEDPRVANSRSTLANVLRAQAKYTEAEAEARRALASLEAALGESHPTVALARGTLGIALSDQGRYAEAELEFTQALRINESSFGREHRSVFESLQNLGTLRHLQGDYEDAVSLFRRAAEIGGQVMGADDPVVAAAHHGIGVELSEIGDYAGAESEHRLALALREARLGADHPEVARSLLYLGEVLNSEGRHEEAEGVLRRALAVLLAALGEAHAETGDAHLHLSKVLADQHRFEDAETEARQAVQILEGARGVDRLRVATAQASFADVLMHRGRASAAIQHATKSWEVLQDEDTRSEDRGRAAFTLAKALWATSSEQRDRDRARDLALKAKEDMQRSAPACRGQIASVDDWLSTHDK